MQGSRVIHGVAVSPGLSIGPAYVVRAAPGEVPTFSIGSEAVEREIERLERALAVARDELAVRQRLVAAQASAKDAEIFAVHRMLLADPGSLAQVKGTIREQRLNAEASVQALIRKLERTLGRLDGDSVRSYASDLSDPWRAVLDVLMKVGSAELVAADKKVVLAAAELTPQVMTSLPRDRLLGVITETGGRFSHGAVLARAFGVPCVVGLPQMLARLEQGMVVAVDGEHGNVQLAPAPEDVQSFETRRARRLARQAELASVAAEPAVTPDGSAMKVFANIESVRDFEMFDTRHTDGVGLLRTEFLYLERSQFPSEDEQFRLYRRVLELMRGKPVVLRTLDIGGDKRLPYFKTPTEPNPALGWRGLRISLEWQDLLRVQLRAALRAGAGHDLRLMLPMVTSTEEIFATRRIFDGVRASLREQGHEVNDDVPVGIMIEVPSILLTLQEAIRHVDFVSVGTNDLVQYLLAVDRDNPWVAKLYEPLHPAVMIALARVAEVAGAARKACSVCGDIADDPAVALLLLGLGYDSVSVAPHFLPEIRFAVRKTPMSRARSLAREVLAQVDIEGVRRTLGAERDRLHAG